MKCFYCSDSSIPIYLMKPLVLFIMLILISGFSLESANHTEIIQVMDDITVRYTLWSASEMDVASSRVWRIEDSSKGICWPDGTAGAKTCNATDATVIGRKPYSGNDTNLEHTVWYVDSDGSRFYVKDTYYIMVVEPDKGTIRWGVTKLGVGGSGTIKVNYPTVSKGGRYYYTEYSSSSSDIVEISSDGVYSAKKVGKATITVKQYVANKNYPDAGSYLLYTDSREIEVEKAVESFSVLENRVLVKRQNVSGKVSVITVFKYTPEDAYFSVTPCLLGHEDMGFLTSFLSGSMPGLERMKFSFYPTEMKDEETLVFTTYNGLEDQCKIILYDPVESVTLDHTTAELPVDEGIQLLATVLPENATYRDLVWMSEDESVATVDNTGFVQTHKKGTVRITAKSEVDDIEAYCDITVIQPVEAIYLSKSEINIKPGEFETLTAYVSPEDAGNKALAWESKDEKVAKVENGTVMGISAGKTLVRAIATDGSGVSAECAVNVAGSSKIEDVVTDKTAYVRIFNMTGILVYEGIYTDAHLVPDYYILMYDGKCIKVRIE